MPKIYFIGVDVGTGSARAALVSSEGKVEKQEVKNTRTWNPVEDNFEQSSTDIWQAVCHCVKSVISNVSKDEIVGISFDATCSLVVLGENGTPLTVSTTENAEQNIILWMDHRAQLETDLINRTKHELLKFVGGQVSVEMEIPKLLWLKKNLPTTWSKLWRAFDLPDFLTWRCTGSDSRSLCSVVCKWNYDAMNMSWSEDYLQQIGLADLAVNEFEKIGKVVLVPGDAVGDGLTEQAAKELGLNPGTIVGTSLIDAHAGALGMFGCKAVSSNDSAEECECSYESNSVEGKMALICGTSTCHMSLTREPCTSNGIWGPYRNAIIPGYFLNEGGQSAAGILLDTVVLKAHPLYAELKSQFGEDKYIYQHLNELLTKMANEKNLDDVGYLTRDLHVWPDFHGNRSPIADPTLRGMITGLSMNITEVESLALIYLAFVQALAYGTRHIIENLLRCGRVPFQAMLFCGGLAKNRLYVKSHADICKIAAVVPDEQEMVLVGAAILGACAARVYDSLEAASNAMGGSGQMLSPKLSTQEYHQKKYNVFLEMLQDQIKYKNLMH